MVHVKAMTRNATLVLRFTMKGPIRDDGHALTQEAAGPRIAIDRLAAPAQRGSAPSRMFRPRELKRRFPACLGFFGSRSPKSRGQADLYGRKRREAQQETIGPPDRQERDLRDPHKT